MKFICKECYYSCVIKCKDFSPQLPVHCPWWCEGAKWRLKEKKEKKAEE